jgi:hypothetical protein
MNPEERLEREIHEALRRLPLPRAPRSLAPRVMQAIAAAAARPETGWRHWALHWQLLGLVLAFSTAVAVVIGSTLLAGWVGNLAATRAVVTLWQTFVAPYALVAVALTAVMCVASALLAAALKHVAWEGQETSTL